MMKSSLKPMRRFAAGAILILTLVAAGCGSNPGHTPTTPSKTPSSSGGSSGGASASGIPQGANAGDADADNHGGPSDGDGNI